jgi:hypothetical protein
MTVTQQPGANGYAPDWQHPDVPRYTPPVVSEPDTTTADVQAAVEAVPVLDDSNSLEFLGRRFRLAESIGLMALLKFAHSAKAGLTSDDMEGLNAMYLLIRSCLDRSQVQTRNPETGEPQFDPSGAPVWDGPSQWELFEQHAIDENADGNDLSDLINRAIQVISSRPTKPRGGSSASSSRTSGSGKAASSSPGTRPIPPGFESMTPVAELGRSTT